MSESTGELRDRSAQILGGLYRARLVVAAAAIVFAALAMAGSLPTLLAVGGFVVMALVATVAMLHAGRGALSVSAAPSPAIGDLVLDAVISGIPDAVVALDHDGRVLAFNSAARVLAPALRSDEPVSIALRMPELADAMRAAKASEAPQRFEFSERAPVDRWFEAIVVPVGSGADQAQLRMFILVTFRDLTPLRRMEEMRADFVANASHELRTPLAALSGFIDTLQGPARDDVAAQRRFLPIMQAQATRMARLIDDLLSLSRIELNAHRRPDARLDVVPLVRQVVDGLQTLARDRDVSVTVQAPTVPPLVQGDRDELIRVFENLIENALKYGASGKRVEIAIAPADVREEGRELLIAVRDFGPGIAPEHLPRLTERFYRVDVVESRAQGGTGLGLALVKHILNRHGGRLSITSTPGAGATFTAHLPLLTAEPR